MAIHRAARPEHHFTQIRNDVLRDERLSYRARGLLAVVLSHTDGWATNSEDLARQGKEGRDAVRTALQELEDAGYLVREKRQDSQGRWATHQVIHDAPQVAEQATLFQVAPTPGNPSPGPGKPTPGNPTPDNQAVIEHQPEDSSPTERAEPPGTVIARAVYEHAQGMVQFLAVRAVAAKALKVKVGSELAQPEAIQRAMIQLYDDGRPLTLTTVGQALARQGFRSTNQDHWAQGGGF